MHRVEMTVVGADLQLDQIESLPKSFGRQFLELQFALET